MTGSYDTHISVERLVPKNVAVLKPIRVGK